MEIKMPYEAEWIIKKIRERGFEAFAVGGCVRDTLLGRIPGDWDITTSARPEEVKEIFGKTVDTDCSTEPLRSSKITKDMRSRRTVSMGNTWMDATRIPWNLPPA